MREDGWIALDRSAFYPTSGGQPHDTGILQWKDGSARVTDVEVDGGVVWHKTDAALPVGTAVHGVVDWDRRWDHMQQHAGDHLLAGTVWQTLAGVTVGLHTGKEDSSIDIEMPGGRTHLTEEEKEQLEILVNQRVQKDDPIRCWFPSEEELKTLPLRKRPTVAEHVRVVAMGDYEMVACGGTHPRSTGQIGPVKILSAAPARGLMRLRFVAGMRAIRYFQEAARSAEEMAAALSAPVRLAPEALRRDREEQREKRADAEEKLLLSALEILRAGKRGRVYAGHLAFADAGLLVRAAGELIKNKEAVVLLSCPGKAGRSLVFARGENVDQDMAALMRACGGRGGGRSDLAQGSAPDERVLDAAADRMAE